MKNNLQAKSGIYKITINSYYIYIGQSVDVKRRWSTHLTELKQNKKSYNKKFQSVFNKYSDKIKFEIIEYCDVDKLDEREMYWIEQFNTYNSDHGLNMSLGGDSNKKFKTREEAEAAALEKYKEYCQTHKEEIKQQHKEYYNVHIDKLKSQAKQYRRQKGILSWKEKFEKRYNLSRPLTDDEWNVWTNNPRINGKSYSKENATRYLQSLPNITFILPTKK